MLCGSADHGHRRKRSWDIERASAGWSGLRHITTAAEPEMIFYRAAGL